MKLYVGYVIYDSSVAVAASIKREEVEKFLDENFDHCDAPYIEKYDLNSFIKFDR